MLGRHVFYNNSAADGRAAAAGFFDDYAVASDKQALVGSGPASAANVTNFSRGINGVMIDVGGLPPGATLTAADFQVSIGNGASWSNGPAPTSVTVRRGAGVDGADRVTLLFADGSVRNAWLRVSLLPSARTGLAAADAFVFGNLAGETFDTAAAQAVTAADVLRTRRNVGTTAPAALEAYDFNRDGVVNAVDLSIVRLNQGRTLASDVNFPPPIVAQSRPAGRAAPTARRTVLGERPASVLEGA